MIAVRPERAGEEAAIAAVHEHAFGRPEEARLVDALRGTAAFVPELSLAAVADGTVVGHLLFSRAEIADDRPGEALALAPMGVEPARQRQGIGSRLVAAGLEACRGRGDRLVVVLGHPGYYPRFGFGPARALGIHPPFAVPDEAWMALALSQEHPLGTVRYPPPFSDLT